MRSSVDLRKKVVETDGATIARSDAGDVITFAQAQTFCCAHPKDPAEYVKPATAYARFKRVGDDL